MSLILFLIGDVGIYVLYHLSRDGNYAALGILWLVALVSMIGWFIEYTKNHT